MSDENVDLYAYVENCVIAFAPKVKEWVFRYFQNNGHHKIKPNIIIGTDSSYDKGRTVFATAIVINSNGFGAEYIFKNYKITRLLSLFEKVYLETHASLLLAESVRKLELKERIGNIIVHIDANTDQSAKSSQYLQSLLGMAKGMGFDAVSKPNSYAATHVADRHCKS